MSGQVVFAMLICELHLPAARSLKEKRRVVKSLVERLHKRFKVSVAESAHHDLHQRSQIAVAAVESTPARLERLLAAMRETAESYDEAMVVRWDEEFVEFEE